MFDFFFNNILSILAPILNDPNARAQRSDEKWHFRLIFEGLFMLPFTYFEPFVVSIPSSFIFFWTVLQSEFILHGLYYTIERLFTEYLPLFENLLGFIVFFIVLWFLICYLSYSTVHNLCVWFLVHYGATYGFQGLLCRFAKFYIRWYSIIGGNLSKRFWKFFCIGGNNSCSTERLGFTILGVLYAINVLNIYLWRSMWDPIDFYFDYEYTENVEA